MASCIELIRSDYTTADRTYSKGSVIIFMAGPSTVSYGALLLIEITCQNEVRLPLFWVSFLKENLNSIFDFEVCLLQVMIS